MSILSQLFLGVLSAAVLAGCTGGDSVFTSNYGTNANVSRNASGTDGQAIIQDRTGKSWDVTHARDKYGLNPSQYQYGIGPFAIQPILNPQMSHPGDPDYPDVRSTFLVMGVQLNGFTRAYPIRVMSWVEVANEKFGEAHVAVAY